MFNFKKEIMLILQNISYIHPNKDLLFENINLNINKQDKIALIGDNGIGKSTLLKIISGIHKPSGGIIQTSSNPYYIPQIYGQFNDYSIAEALQINYKINALKEIIKGNADEKNFESLEDDWLIEERTLESLALWGLNNFRLDTKMGELSGGQKTKVFLAGIAIHQSEIILMDEPSNHLDVTSRDILYNFISETTKTLVIVSHDRKLLNLLPTVYELSKKGITIYGGNYDFYTEQKSIESNALNSDIKSKEKALKKAKEQEKDTLERQQKLDSRGKKKQEKAGVPKILMNGLKNNAERSTAKTKDVHAEKVGNISQELSQLRNGLSGIDQMKFGFNNSSLHKGKVLFKAQNINYAYQDKFLWKRPLNTVINSGDRIAISGFNGSGKTTLVNIVLGKIIPQQGNIETKDYKAIYIDQDYSLINNHLSIYQQAQEFNSTSLQEHEIKIRLNRFLFNKNYWDKPCAVLSGGEKMRLMLCCLTIGTKAPDMIILDEPTNNLDIKNIEILTNAIEDYHGTLIVISHDQCFLEQINIHKLINLS